VKKNLHLEKNTNLPIVAGRPGLSGLHPARVIEVTGVFRIVQTSVNTLPARITDHETMASSGYFYRGGIPGLCRVYAELPFCFGKRVGIYTHGYDKESIRRWY
jgi:hypothetical protein